MIADINTKKVAIVGKTSDSTYQVARLDSSTHAIKTIAYEHSEIHGGSSYEYTGYKDQTVNHVWDIQLSVGGSSKVPHLTFEFDVESATLWHFYEDVNIILAGTTYTPPNHLRSTDKTTNLTVAYITNTTLGNANADTAVAGATTLSEGIAGSGKKVGGQDGSRHEWILNQNMDYCFRWIATAAGYVSWHLDWYDHNDKGE